MRHSFHLYDLIIQKFSDADGIPPISPQVGTQILITFKSIRCYTPKVLSLEVVV